MSYNSSIDERLREVRAAMDFYQAISPTNADEQKELFMDGAIDEPDFRYDDQDVEELRQELYQIEADMEPGEHQELYEDTLFELDTMLTIIEHRGDEETVREASSRIYGTPDAETVDLAEDILRYRDNDAEPEQELDSSQLRERFETFIAEEELDLSVEYADRGTISVNAADGTVHVPDPDRGRQYSDQEADRLVLHELAGHGYRSLNGAEQEAGILGIGAGGYHQTEEGLNTVMEELSGLAEPSMMESYAARVLAVDSMLDGDGFRATYDRLREHEIDEDDAWTTTLRAHRAGGMAKDHIYLQGNQAVWDHLEEADDPEGFQDQVERLYRGKMSLEQVEDHAEELDPADRFPAAVIDQAEDVLDRIL